MENRVMISAYKNVLDKKGRDMDFLTFIAGIKDGKWQDVVLDARMKLAKTKDKKERGAIKQKCPLVRVSGSFSGQSDADIRKHSGYIAIDLDDIQNPNNVKKHLEEDPFIFAAFCSISGHGLCLIFNIDGDRHLDAFNGIAKYLYDKYQLIVDQSGKNVSRARFVSFDPHMNINESASIFKKYLPKPKTQKKTKVVFVESDLDHIISEIYSRGINLCEDYSDWVSICYALVSEFGDSAKGLDHFHTLSSLSSKYNKADSDKQYKSCLRTMSDRKTKISTIGTIYHFAKINGIEIYSKQTKDIIRSASSQSKNGVNRKDIAESLRKHNEIPIDESMPVIKQVIEKGIDHETENIVDDIIHFLQPYNLRKNLVTRNVELLGNPVDDSDLNTLFINCKSMFDKATKDLVCSVIFSHKIPQYNPLYEFFQSEKEIDPEYPNIKRLILSIGSDTENYDKWITKWLVSCVASAYGTYSPLVLVFSGETQGVGKTHFFRYLLPKKLRNLFAESKMDNGKDDEILMTKKLIILDDEYGGKSKTEEKKLKAITSKEFVNVREPYGRVSVDLRRLSMFCGTSNDTQIISDPTGNRRILPVHILSMDHNLFNKCDKEQLWLELYHLYKSGYNYTVLKDEIKELNENTQMFNASSPEEELLLTKFKPGTNDLDGEWMTATDIVKHITMDTKYVFHNNRIGMLLTKHGYSKRRMKRNGSVITGYFVEKITDRDDESDLF